MKKAMLLFSIFLLLKSHAQKSDTKVQPPIYDTTSVDIKSINSFYFCNKLYPIPRDCDKEDNSSCCSFNSQVFWDTKKITSGQLGCYDGTSLFWDYMPSDSVAKVAVLQTMPQIEKQSKSYTSKAGKILLCGNKVDAYFIERESPTNFKMYEIYAWGTINGQSVKIDFMSSKKITSNADLKPAFSQLIQFINKP